MMEEFAELRFVLGDNAIKKAAILHFNGYTIDAISALKSLQTLDFVDPDGIGMWGHSMSGNLVLRAMLIEPDVKAGVIWAGAVYSYDDFARYSITDPSSPVSTIAMSR